VYLSGRAENNVFPIQWLDAAGKTTPLVAQPAIYGGPRLSPDGRRLAYMVGATAQISGSTTWNGMRQRN